MFGFRAVSERKSGAMIEILPDEKSRIRHALRQVRIGRACIARQVATIEARRRRGESTEASERRLRLLEGIQETAEEHYFRMLSCGLASFEKWAFIRGEPTAKPIPGEFGNESYRVTRAFMHAQTARDCVARQKAMIERLRQRELPTAVHEEKLREMERLQKHFERRSAILQAGKNEAVDQPRISGQD
jgi:hypothetical protein